ncbi:uncharacterized protein TM35_000351190 [Trypanosoma theileri]|uniref:Uncharacterized protein n=1 Tax=Trypanosoma theileri TaxID=67003 RepID=A0A1X0NKX1_9TRYP|nr:uncharacterized protein TM35_000351190 [Trypanosoma theileri]ORC85375.1 hypothetical protein TM35_000351190 [Trypanosoma theileri]
MTTRSVARIDENMDPRHFGTSTDDTAIYLEDSMDEPTARCISSSPSVVAILSPQKLPPSSGHAVDLTDYDNGCSGGVSSVKVSRSHPLSDLTNTGVTNLHFSKSPTPRRSVSSSLLQKRSSSGTPGSSQKHHHHHHHNKQQHGSHHHNGVSSALCMDSDHHEERTVPLAEYERLQRERNRYEKMYEHQKVLYEEMSERQSDTYKELQEKIIEVVALSTRNEENKRFIRQLKREMADSRTRVMNIQNRAMEETKMEKSARELYQTQLCEQREKYESCIEKHESRIAGLESLLKDITSMKGECDRIQVSQLDALLKASYAKNTALFGDLLRQGRQIDMLFESKAGLEKQLEQLRREKREMEASWSEERRRMMDETKRYSAQVSEQQRSILELRQMLIRSLESATLAQKEGDNSGEEGDDDSDKTDSSSGSSSYSSEGSLEDDRGLIGNDEIVAAPAPAPTSVPADTIIKTAPHTVGKGTAATVSAAVGEGKEKVQPPLPHTERPLERRMTDIATLSSQIQAKLKSLPPGRI